MLILAEVSEKKEKMLFDLNHKKLDVLGAIPWKKYKNFRYLFHIICIGSKKEGGDYDTIT